MDETIRRRDLLASGAAALGAGAAAPLLKGMPTFAAEPGKAAGFPVSLNTSTLRGHKLPLVEVIEIAAKAGYDGIEPWPNELDDYVAGGGSLADLRQRLKDRNLAVTGAIAFFRWMVDDDAARAEALEEAKRRIEQLHAIGATHVAAPPSGDVKNVDLLRAAERYRKLLDLAEGSGVVPAVEIWGPAPNLHRLGQAVLVALEAQHPRACILPDVFHVYRGGSSFEEFRLLSGGIIGGFHMNDYPASPPRAELKDAHRVYPGDGVGPVAQLFRDLRAIGYSGAVSVELFNPEYYKQDPALVAKTALEKTRAVMRAALEG